MYPAAAHYLCVDTVVFHSLENMCRDKMYAVVGILMLYQYVSCYMSGAPRSVCLGPHTSHDGKKHQLTEVPFKIHFSSSSYSPGQEIRVTLSSPDQKPFKGFVIFAHRTVGDRERPVGQVIRYPTQKAKLTACVYTEEAGITHKNNDTITSLEYTWKAPVTNEGDLVFKYIVVEDFETFWIDQSSDVLQSSTPLTSIPHVEQEDNNVHGINWDECGVTKGCFLYPGFCKGSDCTAAVTYRPLPDNMFEFELFAGNNEYISLGFSHDKIMGRDHALSCTGANEHLSVQNGYNPHRYYMRIYRDDLRNMSVRTVNGRTLCRFVRPKTMVVFTSNWGNETFDLNNTYYLFLAWGPVYENTNVLDHHIELPVVSENMVSLYYIGIIRGSSLPVLTRVHGILMMIAWILFVGITTVVSRYYKGLLSHKMVFGTKYWFQIHRACAVLAWTLTAASFVVIFVQVGGLSENAKLHSYFGIAVMAATTLQVLGGMLRPGLESKIRPAFNVAHWLCGKSCHLLAAISFFLAFYADIVPSQQGEFGIITISVWLGVQVLWEILYEINKCRTKEKYNVSKPAEGGAKQQKTTKVEGVLLVAYVISMMALLAAGICAIVLF